MDDHPDLQDLGQGPVFHQVHPASDRRRIVLVVPRPGRDPRILGCGIPATAVTEIRTILRGDA